MEQTTAWITKDALNSGIERVRGRIHPKEPHIFLYSIYGAYNNEWHLTEDAAIKHAEEMRAQILHHHEQLIYELERLEIKIFDNNLGVKNG